MLEWTRKALAGFAALGAMVAATAAPAADFPATPYLYSVTDPAPRSPFGLLSEVRAGAFYHGYASPEAGLVDVNLELLSPRVVELHRGYWDYLIPRLHLGGNIDTGGRTSDGYLGLTWTTPSFYRVFGEFTLGGSINDGKTAFVPPPGYSAVGCHLMFRESVSLGYQITDHWTVMATAEHISNNKMCPRNAGITNFGGRLGYVF